MQYFSRNTYKIAYKTNNLFKNTINATTKMYDTLEKLKCRIEKGTYLQPLKNTAHVLAKEKVIKNLFRTQMHIKT